MAEESTNVIQVGEVLDKYELLERVGQGGMAVVYRGLDRSLKRVVAVKILHKHLSDYQEARDRFEREAQAVAKLRHENILEIFDYSGADEAKSLGSSYIVTEFIDGHTLKQVVTDRPIQFPEIGAMIMLQVCRALAHAHGAGILHRDVKPENIMVRSDGVVKLMDFGISHMVDLERLTVTGQLLGSPAYMAPEHVEGRQLDFRTDVFAAGIVLYQLTVGRLPFEGKNPHEVLKRIADCKFLDPRQANPQIGNRLGRIILKAMAAEPNDRYTNVDEMVRALAGYLEESGLEADKVASELARYFVAPVAYEQAFEIRLVDHLTTRGQKLLADDNRAAALDVFDRVLTIDPDNHKVVAILDGINRRRRMRQTAMIGAVVAVMGVCAFMIHRRNLPIDGELPNPPSELDNPTTRIRDHHAVPDNLAEPHPLADAAIAVVEPDARGSAVALADAGVDAPPAIAPTLLTVNISPSNSEVSFDGGATWEKVPPAGAITHLADREIAVRGRHPQCAEGEVRAGPAKPNVALALEFKPAQLVPLCDRPNVTEIRIGNQSGTLGAPSAIYFGKTTIEQRSMTVVFVIDGKPQPAQIVTVRAAERTEVRCAAE